MASEESRAEPGTASVSRRLWKGLVEVALWVYRLVRGAVERYSAHFMPQMAAAISYRVLFSIVPLLILLVSVLGVVLRDETRRNDVVGWVVDRLPLSGSAETDLTAAVEGIASPASLAGFVAVVGLIWAASGMMATIRAGLSAAFDGEQRRNALIGKLLDVALVFSMGLLVIVSFAVTTVGELVRKASEDVADDVGAFGDVVTAAGRTTQVSLSVAVIFAVFLVLYHFIPRSRPSFRYAWLGALVAAAGIEIAKIGFAIYVANFSNYNVLYGSLGAILLFLLFVYIASMVFLFGAELSAEFRAQRERRK